MKKIYRILFFLVVLAGSLSSCENEIKFHEGDITPFMVMNGLLSPDSVISVDLSESMSVIDPRGECPRVEDAEVKLYVDGQLRGTLVHTSAGHYVSASGFTPAVGQHIAITAANTRLGSIGGASTMPAVARIDSVAFGNVKKTVEYRLDENGDNGTEPDTIGYFVNYTFNLNLTFTDPAEEANFYRLMMHKRTYENDSSWVTIESIVYDLKDAFNPDVTGELIETTDYTYYYNEFDDKIFDGTTFTLRIPLEVSHYYSYVTDYTHSSQNTPETEEKDKELYIDLQSISSDYFHYLRARGKVDNSSIINDLFTEPIQIYTNIEGGNGILGCYTSNIRKIPLTFTDDTEP